MLKSRKGAWCDLSTAEFQHAVFSDEPLWAYAEVLVFRDKQPKLIGKIEIGLVVGSGREQDDPAFILSQVLLNSPVTLSFSITKVLTFVNDYEPETTQLRQLLQYAGN